MDVAEATVSDWKIGYCSSNVFSNRESCCTSRGPLGTLEELGENCKAWHTWRDDYAGAFAIYVGFALAFGIISSSVTMLTKSSLPSVTVGQESAPKGENQPSEGKKMYMAAGSGIPEIKTILSGFVIPNFLDFKVLVVKAIGATFAVATGMCLGKEGLFMIKCCTLRMLAETKKDRSSTYPHVLRISLAAAFQSIERTEGRCGSSSVPDALQDFLLLSVRARLSVSYVLTCEY